MKEIGSEFSLSADRDFYFKRLREIGKSNLFLRCGRDALGFVADLITMRSAVILMPAYCCDSMVKPFEIRGWNVVYYPVNSDLSVDVSHLLSAYDSYHPDILLIMNFFGLSNTKETAVQIKIKWPNINIIEDITHTLFDFEKSFTTQVDFYVGSIRKWMGITDGAMVISTKTQMSLLDYRESDYINLRQKGLDLKEAYNHSGDPSIKLQFRKMLSDAESTLQDGKKPFLISPDSHSMLDNLNVGSLKNSRKGNASFLLQLLKTIPGINYPGNIDQILTITPFSIPVLINNRNMVQKKMAEKGVYAALLWPLTKKAKEISSVATLMENKMLSIPVDQRYNASDMLHIYNIIKKLVNK